MAGVTPATHAPVAIALGSNLGDRHAHLDRAILALGRVMHVRAVSTRLVTDAVGTPDVQAPYLNAALVGSTAYSPEALLGALLAIEDAAGRQRPYRYAPRTLDLDLILYGALTLTTPRLTVPHPRFRERAFVLMPLAEIAPDWIDPVTGLTVADLAAHIAADDARA